MVKYGNWELRIHEIRGKIDRGELIPDPDWQRGYIWKVKDEQLLIDSILREMPLPKFYLTEEYNLEKEASVHMVVDGQQRLKAIHRFLNNKFDVKIDERKYFFRDLDHATQQKITTYILNGHYLEDFTQADINFLFQRLNRTGVKLTNMEEWNNEFTKTKLLVMVKEIQEEHKSFYGDIIYTEDNVKRMLPLDDIIDLCNCLSRNSVAAGRKNDLVLFLKNNQDISKSESGKLKSKFRKVIINLKEILSRQDIEESYYSKRTHFISLFLATGLLICEYYILSNPAQLKKDLLDFIQEPPNEYRESALGAIRDKVKREQRVNILQGLILKHSKELDTQRNFHESIRRKLYHIEPVCQICGKKITKLRSATVDHKVPWSKGGKTEARNAQLAHKKCNQTKKDSSEEFVIM